MNLLNEQKKPPSQKFFQSQYGSQRFGGQQSQLPAQVFSHNQSMMQSQNPNLMETPDVRNRHNFIPNSEQPRHMQGLSRADNNGEQPGFPMINRNQRQMNQDTPVVHHNMQRNYPTTGQRLHPNFAMQQYVQGFDALAESRREDILTPSPKIDRETKQSEMYNPTFNRSMRQDGSSFQPNPM